MSCTDREWGVFNAEGLIVGGFWGRDAYSADDEVEVCAICYEHEGQRADQCEDCEAEDSEETP